MRILICSDTHFGCASDTVREDDFYKITDIVSDLIKKNQYDLFIHAGDLFNVVKPSNRAILNACQFVRNVSEEVKLSVYCGGNHCKPRMTSVVHPLDLIQLHYHHDNVSMHHTAGYDVIGDIVVFTLPYSFTTAGYDDDIKKFMSVCDEIDGGAFGAGLKKILITHAVYPDMTFMKNIPNIKMNDTLPMSVYQLVQRMDLTINGHIHIPASDDDRHILVTGATEQTSFGEAGERFIYDVCTDNGRMDVRSISLPVRQMIQANLDCVDVVDDEQIYDMCSQVLGSVGDGAMVKVVLSNVDKAVAVSVSKNKIKQLFSGALSIAVQIKTKASEVISFEIQHNIHDITALWDEWSLQLEPHVQTLGRQIIQETL